MYIPDVVYSCRTLNGSDKMLFWYLYNRALEFGCETTFTNKILSKHCTLGESTIPYSLKRLKEHGLISLRYPSKNERVIVVNLEIESWKVS